MQTARIAILILCVPLAACYQSGELGNPVFDLNIIDMLYEFEPGDRILVGTRVCPKLKDDLYSDCYDQKLKGPAIFDANDCVTLDTPGEVTWEVIPTNVEGCESKYVDRITMEVAAPSGALQLGFDDWQLRAPTAKILSEFLSQNVVGLEPGQTLDDMREDPGTPRRVIAGQIDAPMLRLDDELGRLYFGSDVAIELVGAGATLLEPDPELFPGEWPLLLEPDAFVGIRAKLPGGLVLESPELIAVPSSEAASLDLVVALQPGDEMPVFAHARVRDAQGRVLHAAPIEWSVAEGALGVGPGTLDNYGRSGEYAVLSGGCEPPSESEFLERHAVLRARLGTLEDSVELNWLEPPRGPGVDTPFEPYEGCKFGDDEVSCAE